MQEQTIRGAKVHETKLKFRNKAKFSMRFLHNVVSTFKSSAQNHRDRATQYTYLYKSTFRILARYHMCECDALIEIMDLRGIPLTCSVWHKYMRAFSTSIVIQEGDLRRFDTFPPSSRVHDWYIIDANSGTNCACVILASQVYVKRPNKFHREIHVRK